MNLFDLGVLLALAIFALAGWRSGLIKTVFGLASFFITIAAVRWLNPYVSGFLRGTFLYDAIRDWVIKSLDLRGHTALNTDFIANLPLPAAIREQLLSHNTPDVYELLNVSTIEDYIGGYFANIALGAISTVAVFIAVWVLMRLLARALDLVNRLPVIGTLNRAGGLIAGLALGAAVVWLGFIVVYFLASNPNNAPLAEALESSLAARWMFKHNMALWFMV